MHADTPDNPSPKPGFRRVVIIAVVHAQTDQIPHLAQAIAFNGFLAILSALLLAVGVFSATVGPGSMQTLLDHLNGVLMLDRMTPDQRREALAEYERFQAAAEPPAGRTRRLRLR